MHIVSSLPTGSYEKTRTMIRLLRISGLPNFSYLRNHWYIGTQDTYRFGACSSIRLKEINDREADLLNSLLDAILGFEYKDPKTCSACEQDRHRECSVRKIVKVSIGGDIHEKIFELSCCCMKESWNERITTRSPSFSFEYERGGVLQNRSPNL